MHENNFKISVITVTLNAAEHLPALIASLRSQTCKNFEWIVADGISSDKTLLLLEQAKDLNLSVVSESDFSLYDAMNKAVKRCNTNHYIVIGADDTFNSNTIESIVDHLNENNDIDLLIGNVTANGKLLKVRKGLKILYGARAFVSAHSVGCVFNKNIHKKFDYYTNKYSIQADSYLIKKMFEDPKLKFKYVDQTFGNFAINGLSNTDAWRSQCESLHIQLVTEKYKFIQILLFILRYIKYRLI